MRSNSETVKMARITNYIRAVHPVGVDESELQRILREHRVSAQKEAYYTHALAEWGYLQYDPVDCKYNLTKDSRKAASFTVVVTPGLHNAEEVRQMVVSMFARYGSIIEVKKMVQYDI